MQTAQLSADCLTHDRRPQSNLMASPLSWLVFPILVVATALFTRRPPLSSTPARPLHITSAAWNPQSSIAPNNFPILMLLFDPSITDKQLVSELKELALISLHAPPAKFHEMQDLLNEADSVSYLATRLFDMRDVKQIDAALIALEILSGVRHVAAFLLGLVTCEIDWLLEHDDGDLDADLCHYRELEHILLAYCGETVLDDIPESVTEQSQLFLAAGGLRFEDPGAVRRFLLSPQTQLRTDSHLLLTLMRCGVQFTLREVLQSELTLEEFHVMLPYVDDMQSGIEHLLEDLLRDRRHDWIRAIFNHILFRYEFMFQVDYSYLVSALQRAVDAERWDDAVFLLRLPGHWQLTSQVMELSARIPSHIPDIHTIHPSIGDPAGHELG